MSASTKHPRPRGPQQFRRRVEAFLGSTGMARSRFGLLACRDANFCFQLREGREPRAATVNAVLSFMRRHAAKTARRRKRPPIRSKSQRTSKPPSDGQAVVSRP